LSEHTFDKANTTEAEYPIKVALGFKSPEAKASFYSDMASRMAGEIPSCTMATVDLDEPTDAPTLDDSSGNIVSLHTAANAMALTVAAVVIL
jgi:hypothetical protein